MLNNIKNKKIPLIVFISLLIVTVSACLVFAVTLGGNLSAGGYRITTLGTPTADTDGATKGYVDAAGIESGMVVMFTSSCPSGWTRFTALDNRFPRGAASYGATGGSNTLSHSVGRDGYDGNFFRDTAIDTIYNHTDYWPPYLDVIWCQKD